MLQADPAAVVYLARGADADPLPRFERFARSYERFAAGEEHALFVILKGFDGPAHLQSAKAAFKGLACGFICTDDDSFDLGAYRDATRSIPHGRLCFLNTNSELMAENWLAKLSANFVLPHVGLVGATASMESLALLDRRFQKYPNPHIRSNAFMMSRETFLHATDRVTFATKLDAFMVESGPTSLTQRVVQSGQSVLLVGRNGRGYAPSRWTDSATFRLRNQDNLLVHDNVTRMFDASPFPRKQELSRATWGEKLDGR